MNRLPYLLELIFLFTEFSLLGASAPPRLGVNFRKLPFHAFNLRSFAASILFPRRLLGGTVVDRIEEQFESCVRLGPILNAETEQDDSASSQGHFHNGCLVLEVPLSK